MQLVSFSQVSHVMPEQIDCRQLALLDCIVESLLDEQARNVFECFCDRLLLLFLFFFWEQELLVFPPDFLLQSFDLYYTMGQPLTA